MNFIWDKITEWLKGMLVSGIILIYLLPAVAGADSIWFAMPITELVVVVFVAAMMGRYQKQGGSNSIARTLHS